MARKLALVLAVLALTSIANAAVRSNTPTAASFDNVTVPVTSYLTSSATAWFNTLSYQGNYWGAAATNASFNTFNVAGTTTLTVNKLSTAIDSSSLAYTSTPSTLTGGSDCTTTAVAKTATNGFAYACALAGTTDTQQDVWLSYANAAASSFTKAQITTTTTNSTNVLTVLDLWYDETTTYWYVAFRIEDDSSHTLSINLQAVNTTGTAAVEFGANGVALYTGSTSISTSAITFGAIGPNSITNATTATFLYKDTTSTGVVKSVQVTLSGTGSAASAVTVVTDGDNGVAVASADASTPYVAVVYTPAGFICGTSNYSVAVLQKNTSTPGNPASVSATAWLGQIQVYTEGNTTSGFNLTLADTTSSVTGSAQGTPYGEGWSVITTESSTSGDVIKYTNFYYNGSMNGTTTTVGTFNDQRGFWLDANGSYWLGYVSSVDADDTSTTPTTSSNTIQNLYAGKLFGQVSLFANTLSSVFAFVALMIAAVFAF